jgi:peptidoglycan/xylan/chitin deacetylase (PgdA/CDA1 family)
MNLLVLTYHYFHREMSVGVKPGDELFSVDLDTLEVHCREMAAPDFRLIAPDNVADRAQYRGEPDRQILVTIDDGHRTVLDAEEILIKAGITPILNVIPSLVGQENYLDWANLRHLATLGFSIQSHSMSHHDLTRLNDMELSAELEKSKKIIEDNIGMPVTMVAAPMGRVNSRVAAAALEADYQVVMTSFTGINTDIDDLKFLKRFQVKSNRGPKGWHDYFSSMSNVRIMGAAKNLAKKARGRLTK